MSEEYRKLWHDRIDAFANKESNVDMYGLLNSAYKIMRVVLFKNDISDKLKAKFDKGMAEHGLGFEKVDFDEEIENEILDLCNYLIGKHYDTTRNK